jgi:Protein of unknown function (DUF1549)/Protein of unknown function (DUF1553)
MTPERDDPIIDPLLEELLGQQQPPDLTARILAAWGERSSSIAPAKQPIVIGKRRRKYQEWIQYAVSALAAAALLGVAYIGFTWSNNQPAPIAQQPTPSNQTTSNEKQSAQLVPPTQQAVQQPDTNKNTHPTAPQLTIAPNPQREKTVENQPASPTHHQPAPNKPVLTPETVATNENLPHDAEMIAFVNAQLHQAWTTHRVTPAPLADDASWCRRVFVRLIGRIPSVEELQQFAADRTDNKRSKLVAQLLHDEAYAIDYARHWSSVWANVLLGRGVGIDANELANREGLEKYLRDAFARNRSFDLIVKDLLTATGTGQPGSDQFNGAANYLMAASDDRGITATDRTCRLFLGVRLQCAQCHNHPTQSWKQADFWSMNAYFRQFKVRQSDRNDPAQLLDYDYLGDDGRDPQGLVFYELPNGVLQAAEPRFLTGQSPATTSGYVAEENRREELAQLIVNSNLFGESLVNRVWSQFHGYGFTKPLDDMGPANPPSHPALLQRLAQEFAAQKYDFKRMLTWIALSDSFQRASSADSHQVIDAPALGTQPLFSYYYARPLAGEEVIRSLQIAAKLRRESGNNGNIAQARVDWLAQYQRSQPKTEATEIAPVMATENSIIPSGLMKHATTVGQDGLLQSVLQSKLPYADKVEHLFLAALSRKPTPAERKAAEKLAGVTGMQESAALEDIWWALLNSSEFLLDH